MTTGATGQLGLALPVQGELSGTWGDTVNNGITQYTNIAIAATLTLTNDGAVTLANTTGDASASNITSSLTGAGTVTAQFAIVRITGTLTTTKVVTAPSYSKTYVVVNAATGGTVTFKASGQTGVSIAVGESAWVYYNGTDYVKIVGTATAGAAGGSNTQVQYNSSGSLAGSSNLTFDGTNLTLGGGTANGVTYLNGSKVLTSGSALTYNGTTFSSSNTGGSYLFKFSDTTNNNSLGLYSDATNMRLMSLDNTFTTFKSMNFYGTPFVFYENGTEAMRLNSTGLGVGTSNPSGKIHSQVATPSTAGIASIYYGGDGTKQFQLLQTGATYNTAGAGGNELWYYTASYSALTFGSDGNIPIKWVSNGSEQMRLTSTGLGIGTSSPAVKLQVNGSGQILRVTDGTTGASIYSGGGLFGFNNQTGEDGMFGSTASHYLYFATAGTEKMRLDSAGNLGLGVTPSAWGSPYKTISVNGIFNSIAGNSTYGLDLVSNAYYSSGWKYTNSSVTALKFDANDTAAGQFTWQGAGTGTADGAITWTTRMVLDSSGNLGVGTTSPAFGSGSGIEIERSGTATLRLERTSSSAAVVELKAESGAGVLETRDATPLIFGTSATERARINSSGFALFSNTGTYGSATNTAYEFSNSTSNQDTIQFRNTASSLPYGLNVIFTNASPNDATRYYLRCADGGGTVRAYLYSNGGLANYQANNSNLSDRREKTNFAPAKSYLDKICAIPVQTFNYIDQNLEEDDGLTLGVVAQDVQAVAPELVTESNWGTEEEPKMRLSIYQTDLQYALMKCIQEQQAIIESLKARLDAANL